MTFSSLFSHFIGTVDSALPLVFSRHSSPLSSAQVWREATRNVSLLLLLLRPVLLPATATRDGSGLDLLRRNSRPRLLPPLRQRRRQTSLGLKKKEEA